MIRVVLADDHNMVRAGLASLVESFENIEILGEANDGRECLELVEQLRPDVVVMDIFMPELNGLDATARITAKYPATKVVVLSLSPSEEYLIQALRAGAVGFLLKDGEPEELERAIHAVKEGGTYFTPSISKRLVDLALSPSESANTSLDRLTARQREVLQLVAEGNSTKQIARKLGISNKTVEAHRMQLMATLEIHDIAGLTRYAIRMGVISPDF